MDNPIIAEAWAALSADQRINLCLLMAMKARELCAMAEPKDRPAYSDLADRWDLLASEMGSATAAQLTRKERRLAEAGSQ